MPTPITFGAISARAFGFLGKLKAITDPYFKYVTMLLPGNGTNGAQNNTFLDSSTNNFTITRNGNTTQGTFTPYGSNWSNYFDGSGDWLDVASNAAFGYGTGDFTIEFWVFPTSATGTQVYLDQRAGSATSAAPTIYTISGTIYYYVSGNNRITGGTVTANQWSHIALARSGTSTKLFINGVQTGSTYSDSTNYVTAPVRIGDGNDGAGPYPFPGYVSNFRILKGTALYTSAFTPPTAPLTAITNTSLLTCQSNRFIDNSTNNFTITRNGNVSVQRFSPFNPTTPYAAGTIGGSGYWDGTGDALSLPSSSNLALGTGDFTIEMWVNGANDGSIVGGSYRRLFSLGTGQTSGAIDVYNASGTIYVSLSGGTGISFSGSSILNNAWNHFAITRSGTSLRVFGNGTLIVSATNNTDLTSASVNASFIGALNASAGNFLGYISDFRVLKGTALYTAAFTPPTAPLTAITNTSLLLNFTNGGIIDNAMMNDLETVGNAQISTSVSKFGGGSVALTAAGDYLRSQQASALWDFGTGSWTIEGWINPTSLPGAGSTFYSGSNSSFLIILFSNGVQIFENSTTAYKQYNLTIATNAWQHIAIVRNGAATPTVYLNGVAYTSTAGYSGVYGLAADFAEIGYDATYPSNKFYGYIDDLRITKGYARYTANFTPPTQTFPTY